MVLRDAKLLCEVQSEDSRTELYISSTHRANKKED